MHQPRSQVRVFNYKHRLWLVECVYVVNGLRCLCVSGLTRKRGEQECWRTLKKDKSTVSISSGNLSETSPQRSCPLSTASLLTLTETRIIILSSVSYFFSTKISKATPLSGEGGVKGFIVCVCDYYYIVSGYWAEGSGGLVEIIPMEVVCPSLWLVDSQAHPNRSWFINLAAIWYF